MRKRATLVGVALSAVAALWLTYGYAGAQELVEGNPKCADLGIPNELKVEPPATGTYGDGKLEVFVDVNGKFFDWNTTQSSQEAVDAVIVKGGPNANVYSYDEATADSGLSAPMNPKNGQPYGLSHISFCYDLGGDGGGGGGGGGGPGSGGAPGSGGGAPSAGPAKAVAGQPAFTG